MGAFVGSYLFPIIQDRAPNPTRAGQDPFFVASTLAIFAGVIAMLCLPNIEQDSIDAEDVRFRQYLMDHGYDTSKMGLVAVADEGVRDGERKEGYA